MKTEGNSKEKGNGEVRRRGGDSYYPMNFSLFYDNGPETARNTNPAVPGHQPTGQMFGGYYVGRPPYAGDDLTHYYHNGAFYSDPRISAPLVTTKA